MLLLVDNKICSSNIYFPYIGCLSVFASIISVEREIAAFLNYMESQFFLKLPGLLQKAHNKCECVLCISVHISFN